MIMFFLVLLTTFVYLTIVFTIRSLIIKLEEILWHFTNQEIE